MNAVRRAPRGLDVADENENDDEAETSETERRSARDILVEVRLLRQRAAILSHLGEVLSRNFLPSEATQLTALWVKLGDAGAVPPDLDVVLKLLQSLDKGAADAHTRSRRLLRATVEAPTGAPRDALFGGGLWGWTREPDANADAEAAEDGIVERPVSAGKRTSRLVP